MTNTVIYLVRHGQTDWNVQGRTQGLKGVPLNRTGIRQMRALREKIKHAPIDVIVSSPLRRARESARILARGRPVHVLPELQERNHGLTEGLTREELLRRFPAIEQEWERDGIDWLPPGNGETMRQSYIRSARALERLLQHYPGKRILAVTHNGLLKQMLVHILKKAPEAALTSPPLRNAGMLRVMHDGNCYHLRVLPKAFK